MPQKGIFAQIFNRQEPMAPVTHSLLIWCPQLILGSCHEADYIAGWQPLPDNFPDVDADLLPLDDIEL